MNEQQRMERFYKSYPGDGAKVLGKIIAWEKDEEDNYLAPVTQVLWAAWQAAQYGYQMSFDFSSRPQGGFGEK